ncbi:universal stress protein [Massilia jejuensis]|uniref:Universal stress protein n=1 Tax=Massilia jejuensis TaxID=648894 RepID=A0ABW0PIW7_9BURK
MFKRILVPTDGSAPARAATAAAIGLATEMGAEIVAFSVVQPAPLLFAADNAMALAGGADLGILEDEARRIVGEVAAAAHAAGVPCRALTAMSLATGDEIVDAVRRAGCDLVVMGSHGRHGLARLKVGSQTMRVLSTSPVPVLVLPPSAPRA